MIQTITLGDIDIEVIQKDIKNVHLSVHPPLGRVTIAAPLHLNMDTIRIYSISKLGWIKKQQTKFRKQKREKARLFISRESHYLLGKRYMLKIVPATGKHQIEVKVNKIFMHVHPESTTENRQRLMEEFHRAQLKAIIAPLIQKWQRTLKVSANDVRIYKMSTKWGSCNERTGRILLNLELAKKPVEMIEYVIVHELAHLIERKHNDKFVAVMDKFMPNWKVMKDGLNEIGI